MRKILLAETAGFCFGVDRAVKMVEDLLKDGRRVYTLGPIIHNPQLVKELEERGALIAASIDDVPAGETLIISSHGAAADVYKSAAEKNIQLIDATCPYVAKIHRIVRKVWEDGRLLLVAGDAEHTEIRGIIGHYPGKSLVFKDDKELEKMLSGKEFDVNCPAAVISQTTFNQKMWDECKKKLKKVCTNLVVFDTICKATAKRQDEAAEIARAADVMIVVGGRQSSNTAKLKDVSEKYAPTYLVETAEELPMEVLAGVGCVGVTAGASTPAHIIKEVLDTMSEEKVNTIRETDEEVKAVPAEETASDEQQTAPQKSFDDMTFEEALEASLNSLNSDQKVRGVVMSINPTEVQVDIGRKHAGIIPVSELSNDPGVKPEDVVKVGDELDLIVIKTNDAEGIVTLSRRRYEALAGWEQILAAKDSGEPVDGVVRSVVKGGVQALSNGVRIFIPASHASLSRGESLEPLVGKQVKIEIIEINRGRRAVGSIRKFLRAQRKEREEEFWSNIAIGQVYEGTVKSMTSYGAFVDLGPVDGMIHISELSWSRIKSPEDVLKIGQKVTVYIKDIDTEKHKISLGYKKEEDNPWNILKNGYSVGQVVPVKVVSIKPYGAFVNVINGIDGLIHISQIADHRIENPASELQIGQEVNAKITEIDFENKRVSLSIRALLEEAKEKEEKDIVEEYNRSVAEKEKSETGAAGGEDGSSDTEQAAEAAAVPSDDTAPEADKAADVEGSAE